MAIVNLNQLFANGTDVDWAVGHFNVHNHEFLRAVIDIADQEKAPTVIAIGMASIRYMGMAPIFAAARQMAEEAAVPLSIHLDHARDIRLVKQALDLGFTSVMFDGSDLPYDENIDLTRKVVHMAHKVGASAEGEIGILPPSLDQIGSDGFTDPQEAVDFVKATGVDFVAVSLGSVHGMQTPGAHLDLGLLAALYKSLDCPMVLHGASGVVDQDIQGAIKSGIRKVNINTLLKVVFKDGLNESLAAAPEGDLLADLDAGMSGVRAAVIERIRILGSKGKAEQAL